MHSFELDVIYLSQITRVRAALMLSSKPLTCNFVHSIQETLNFIVTQKWVTYASSAELLFPLLKIQNHPETY